MNQSETTKAAEDEVSNPNENCLEGMACPTCGQFGPFSIYATQSGTTRVSDDGTDAINGDVEWDDDSGCMCDCGHSATVRQFRGKTEPVPAFGRYQQIVLAAYNGGFHAVASPSDAPNCGDLLLRFALAELSESEGCDSVENALQRTDNAITRLVALRAALVGSL